MIKYYCVKCMMLLDEEKICLRCGNKEVKRIEINIQAKNNERCS